MTYQDLYEKAIRLLDNGEITIGEYEEMIKPLKREICEWIPVSERPPKENGKYIASLEDSVYPEASFFNGKWFMRSLNGIAREFGEYEVIAWMPLPPVYQGE